MISKQQTQSGVKQNSKGNKEQKWQTVWFITIKRPFKLHQQNKLWFKQTEGKKIFKSCLNSHYQSNSRNSFNH